MLNRSYSLSQILKLSIWVLRTKLICRKARIIYFPADIRGKKFINFGANLSIGVGARIEAFDNGEGIHSISFGNDVQVNDYVHIVGMNSVKIGNNVLMASHIFISDNSHGSYKGDEVDSDPNIPPIKRSYPTSPISIGDNTWICEGVMVMPGSAIGKGCIIGAHSIVRGVIPDYCIAVGNPAKVIKHYNFETKHWERI